MVITSVKLSPFWFYWMVDTPQTWMTEVYRDVLVYVVFRRLESGVTIGLIPNETEETPNPFTDTFQSRISITGTLFLTTSVFTTIQVTGGVYNSGYKTI